MDASAVTAQWLLQRLVKASARWDAAMARPGYRDDPEEAVANGEPFSSEDWGLYRWANAWRLQFHVVEREMFALRCVRHLHLEGHRESAGSGASWTVFVVEASDFGPAFGQDDPQDTERSALPKPKKAPRRGTPKPRPAIPKKPDESAS